jgi:hypothetical protein
VNYAEQENVWDSAGFPASPENFILRFLGTGDIRSERPWVKAHDEIFLKQSPTQKPIDPRGSQKTQWRILPLVLS